MEYIHSLYGIVNDTTILSRQHISCLWQPTAVSGYLAARVSFPAAAAAAAAALDGQVVRLGRPGYGQGAPLVTWQRY